MNQQIQQTLHDHAVNGGTLATWLGSMWAWFGTNYNELAGICVVVSTACVLYNTYRNSKKPKK